MQTLMTEAEWLAQYNARRNAKRKATVEAKKAKQAAHRAKYGAMEDQKRENLADMIYSFASAGSPFQTQPPAVANVWQSKAPEK